MRNRPAPVRPGTDEPRRDASERDPRQEVGPVALAEDEGRVVDRPRDRDRKERDQEQADPALGRASAQSAPQGLAHDARPSASRRPGVRPWTFSSYSARA